MSPGLLRLRTVADGEKQESIALDGEFIISSGFGEAIAAATEWEVSILELVMSRD